MASVFLNKKKSKYWVACFTVGGKQVQRSTRVMDEGLAQGIAVAYEKTARDAEIGTITQERLSDTLNFILYLAGSETIRIPSIREWFTTWTTNAKASRSPGTEKRYEGLKNTFLKNLGGKADKSIQTLSVGDVENFRKFLKARGEAPASISLALKAVRTCLNRAVAQGFIRHNRALAVDLVPGDNSGND